MNAKTQDLKFLFQKELNESDMDNIERIVIPEKEAESNLPTLTNPKAMLRMVDMDTLETWTFIYRCRVNNKSKMYILENTGEFLKSHYLVCGDFIKVYKHSLNGKYVIKGKKLLDNEDALENLTEINIFNSMHGGCEQCTHDTNHDDGSRELLPITVLCIAARASNEDNDFTLCNIL